MIVDLVEATPRGLGGPRRRGQGLDDGTLARKARLPEVGLLRARGHSRYRSNVIGTPCARDGSGLSVTWTCTCGWVELPELPHSPSAVPPPPRRRRATPRIRSAVGQGDEVVAVAQRDGHVVAGDAATPGAAAPAWPNAYGTSVSCDRRAT